MKYFIRSIVNYDDMLDRENQRRTETLASKAAALKGVRYFELFQLKNHVNSCR